MRKKGLSLVSILIIVVIIAVVGAVSYPIYLKSKEKMKETKCLSNLRELGNAMLAYTTDNNNAYPCASPTVFAKMEGDAFCGHFPMVEGIREKVQKQSIRLALMPYIKNEEIFVCPMDPDVSLTYEQGKRFTSYHYRYFVGARLTDGEQKEPLTKSTLPFPARTYAFNDFLPYHKGKRIPGSEVGVDFLWPWTPDSKFNMVFFDGHAAIFAAKDSIAWKDTRYDYHWPVVSEGIPWTSTTMLWDIK